MKGPRIAIGPDNTSQPAGRRPSTNNKNSIGEQGKPLSDMQGSMAGASCKSQSNKKVAPPPNADKATKRFK